MNIFCCQSVEKGDEIPVLVAEENTISEIQEVKIDLDSLSEMELEVDRIEGNLDNFDRYYLDHMSRPAGALEGYYEDERLVCLTTYRAGELGGYVSHFYLENERPFAILEYDLFFLYEDSVNIVGDYVKIKTVEKMTYVKGDSVYFEKDTVLTYNYGSNGFPDLSELLEDFEVMKSQLTEEGVSELEH